jgi:hypothetical protein
MEAATRERKMQKAFVLALTVSATLALVALQTARADDRVSETNYYAAYYDRHYGPISDGYWDRHNKYFWYEDTSGRWHQDDGSHFQREPAPGYALIHGTGAPRTH